MQHTSARHSSFLATTALHLSCNPVFQVEVLFRDCRLGCETVLKVDENGRGMGKLIGYARVSTRTQDTDRQVADLLSAGVRREDLYVDHGVSGTGPTTSPRSPTPQ